MSERSAAPAINEEKMHAFLGKVVTDFGASMSVILSYIGTKLGLLKRENKLLAGVDLFVLNFFQAWREYEKKF